LIPFSLGIVFLVRKTFPLAGLFPQAVLVISLLLLVFRSVRHRFGNLVCRGSVLPMSLKSEWFNYPPSELESTLALRDSKAGLRMGLWEDEKPLDFASAYGICSSAFGGL